MTDTATRIAPITRSLSILASTVNRVALAAAPVGTTVIARRTSDSFTKTRNDRWRNDRSNYAQSSDDLFRVHRYDGISWTAASTSA